MTSQNHVTQVTRYGDLAERLYKFNGSMIVTWWDNIKENKLFGTKTSFIEMTSNESFKITTSKQMN